VKLRYISEAWLVLLLATGFALALAAVDLAWKTRIEENKRRETIGQIPHLVPGAVRGQKEFVGKVYVYRAFDSAGRHVGWVLPAVGQGFADRIELLIGLDSEAEYITGLYVLEQKETPGLGANIIAAQWRKQFTGKPATLPLHVSQAAIGENEIQAVTGATISSESVVSIVNEAVAGFRRALEGWER